MEIKDPHIKKIKSVLRTIVCDYCGHKQVKPDQREKQIQGWAKIQIKEIILSKDLFKYPKVAYHKMDMCPDCLKEKRIHETAIGRINIQ